MEPRIPDDAFQQALERLNAFLKVAEPSGDAAGRTAADNFSRSLGLDGDIDERARALCRVVIGHVRGIDHDALDDEDVQAGAIGVTLGLLLAQATGWDPPLSEN